MVDFSDVGETLEARNNKTSRALLKVCRCGHSARSHRSVRENGSFDREKCKVGAVACNCEKYDGVVEVPTVKYFRYSTRGSGKDHPLILGWAKTQTEDGREIVPLEGYTCAVNDCPYKTERVWPVLWDNKGGRNQPAGDIDTGVTMLICQQHILDNGLGHILP